MYMTTDVKEVDTLPPAAAIIFFKCAQVHISIRKVQSP